MTFFVACTVSVISSACSVQINSLRKFAGSHTVDLVAPEAATAIIWTGTSPVVTPTTTVSWTKSASDDLANQTLQFYADGVCGVTSGSIITLNSSTQSYAWTPPADGDYSYKVASMDLAGNTIASSCSPAITIDRPPEAATALAWTETTPYLSNDLTVHVTWTKSVAADLANQTIQFFTDSGCTVSSGSAIDLASISTASTTFTAPVSDFYHFVVTSVDAIGNTTASACSPALDVREPMALSPASFSFAAGEDLSTSFKGVGGSRSYTYSIVSGVGSINSTTGVYTSAGGARAPGSTTVVRAQDSDGATSDSTITHLSFSTNNTVSTSATDGTSIYLGGDFTAVNPETVRGFNAVDPTTGATNNRSFLSKIDGSIYTIAITERFAYIAGLFSTYDSIPVQNLIKIDVRTGALDTTFSQATGPNATVTSLVLSGQDLYVGGAFSAYRGNTDGANLVKLDALTGAMDTTNFNTAGAGGPAGTVRVLKLSADKTNLYVGGSFTAYRGNTAGRYLAKVNSTTGALDSASFNSVGGPSGTIYALELSGNDLYVGGSFTTYRTDNKGYYLAKVDATTGVLETTAFNTTASTGPNSIVYSLLLSGTDLYVGGTFSTYRGLTKGGRLAKVSTLTGVMDTTTFNTVAGPDGAIRSIALSGNDLYIAGDLSTYRGDTSAAFLAKLNALTGVLDTANFNTAPGYGPNGTVQALVLKNSTLYIAGVFGHYRGDARGNRLVKVNATTGVVDSVFHSVPTGFDNSVNSVYYSGSSLYVGGIFSNYRGDARGLGLVKLDPTTGAMDTANFNTVGSGLDGSIYTMTSYMNDLYVGGFFTTYRGDTSSPYVMKLNATTGAMDPAFMTTPGPSNYANSLALSPTGTDLYIGGNFSSYRGDGNGAYLVKVSTANGNMDPTFNSAAGPSGIVNSLILSGSDLYAAGTFSNYRGDNKGFKLVKVDATSGALDPTFNSTASSGPDAGVQTMALVGSDLYIGGAFANYRGSPNGSQLAKLSTVDGSMDTANFNTAPSLGTNYAISTMVLNGSDLYIGGAFNLYRGVSAPFTTGVDRATGVRLNW